MYLRITVGIPGLCFPLHPCNTASYSVCPCIIVIILGVSVTSPPYLESSATACSARPVSCRYPSCVAVVRR